jgi:hypothetical protein
MKESKNHDIKRIFVVLIPVLFFTASLVWADSELVTISGTLLYNGIPMSEITSVEPIFFCNDADTGEKSLDITTTYDNTTGAFTISGLPKHNLVLFFIFHIQGEQSTLPGNYRIYIHVDVNNLSRWDKLHFDVGMEYIIHMVTPWDNGNVDFYGYPDDPYPVHSNPFVFIWERVIGAKRYEFLIFTCRDPDHPGGYGFESLIVDAILDENYYAIELPPSEYQEHYEATILAYNGYGEKIGKFMTTYENGYGWDYRFKVPNNSIGDFNGDYCVDFEDFAIMTDFWWTDYSLVDIAPAPSGDGKVNELDLIVLCDNWLLGR